MSEKTWSQSIADQGMDANMREYQQLKVSAEMEREATAKLYESLKSKHGESAARVMLKQRGYNINILR